MANAMAGAKWMTYAELGELIGGTSELDFAQIRWGFVSAVECSSGEACRVEQAVGERSGDFYHVPALA